jgi:neutral ceramidase
VSSALAARSAILAIVLLRCLVTLVLLAGPAFAGLRAGAARRDVTPTEPVPMWGYGARHDALSTGVLDPLYAEALVLDFDGRKLAIVGLDLGRAPAEHSLQAIRARIKAEAGIEYSLIGGSHTHHGPVLELSDEPGKGQGKFDAALRYYKRMEAAIADAIIEANAHLEPARLGAARSVLQGFNRNRHTKIEPKPVDSGLIVLRVDHADTGKPLAIVVNFTAHPTMLPAEKLQFSADYPGAMKAAVAAESGAHVLFIQGAAGDQSVSDFTKGGYRTFGAALATEVSKLAASIATAEPTPEKPATLDWREERFRFSSRTDFKNPFVKMAFSQAFFPELIPNYIDEYADGVRPRLSLALIDREIALVGVSGEFFSNHAIRLRERARVKQLLFVGYANGYHQYFPTIEAVAEGGYGADAAVSPVAVGAGEQIMNTALEWIYRMLGKIRQ